MSHVLPWFSYGFPLFCCGFAVVFLWFSLWFSVFPWFSYGFSPIPRSPPSVPQRPRRLFTAIRAASSASEVSCWSSSQTKCAAAGNLAEGGWSGDLLCKMCIKKICMHTYVCMYVCIYIYIYHIYLNYRERIHYNYELRLSYATLQLQLHYSTLHAALVVR